MILGNMTLHQERSAWYAQKLDRLWDEWLQIQSIRVATEPETHERIARCQARKADMLARAAELLMKESMMKAQRMNRPSIASDYAVLEIPSKGMSFYFGYESAPADDPGNWCFRYQAGSETEGTLRITEYSYRALGMQTPWDVTDGLLRGMAQMISDGYLRVEETR